MNGETGLTPIKLIEEFRKVRNYIGKAALQEFEKLPPQERQEYFNPTIEFLKTETNDRVRSWGTSVLRIIGGEKAFMFLADLLRRADAEEKKRYPRTRLFALKTLTVTAITERQKDQLSQIINEISKDNDERGFVSAASKILLAKQGKAPVFEKELRDTLRDYDDYKAFRSITRILRALREFPCARLTGEILMVIRNCEYTEHRRQAIKTLSSVEYVGNNEVIRVLGGVVVNCDDTYSRLEAVKSLAVLGDPEAEGDLLKALKDIDAEVRVQASNSLVSLLGKEGALPAVIQQALREEEEKGRDRLIEAIRRMDPDRRISVDILSKELGGEDRKRSQTAEKVLLELGGAAAVQRLSQLRKTLDYLDNLLSKSEDVIKSTFKDTIRQARLNFYFAMVINALVVGIGIALIVLAMIHMAGDPTRFESWVIPGAAGVLGIITNLFYNSPRRNARQDMATLMNVNIIFLGYLRQLNEIDATFKHEFIEVEDFGIGTMEKTVQQIEKAMCRTLEMAAFNLRDPRRREQGNVPVIPTNVDGNGAGTQTLTTVQQEEPVTS
ncbi:MAG: HEAT repeat domain-containing protein [Candidatus Zixiibacteriota bacterium]|jgi:HEAT repeat protein